MLLGIVKYFWGQTVFILAKEKNFSLFRARLNSIVSDGLNVPKIPAEYMFLYRGSLIKKHFKTISQIMVFIVYDLVPRDVLDACIILGRLMVLLWHTEIEDIDAYTVRRASKLLRYCANIMQEALSKTINDFLNITTRCSPSILLTKPKFHFLIHLPAFIRRFGPAVLFSTERHEAYNAIFCAASVYSNRAAPSRDIAWSFAGMDQVKHIATGGWWKDAGTPAWCHASKTVVDYIGSSSSYCALLGIPTLTEHESGVLL